MGGQVGVVGPGNNTIFSNVLCQRGRPHVAAELKTRVGHPSIEVIRTPMLSEDKHKCRPHLSQTGSGALSCSKFQPIVCFQDLFHSSRARCRSEGGHGPKMDTRDPSHCEQISPGVESGKTWSCRVSLSMAIPPPPSIEHPRCLDFRTSPRIQKSLKFGSSERYEIAGCSQGHRPAPAMQSGVASARQAVLFAFARSRTFLIPHFVAGFGPPCSPEQPGHRTYGTNAPPPEVPSRL